MQFGATEEVAATNNDGDLHTLLDRGNDFLRNTTNDGGVDADFASAECLSGQLEQYPAGIVASVFASHEMPFLPENP